MIVFLPKIWPRPTNECSQWPVSITSVKRNKSYENIRRNLYLEHFRRPTFKYFVNLFLFQNYKIIVNALQVQPSISKGTVCYPNLANLLGSLTSVLIYLLSVSTPQNVNFAHKVPL